MNKGRRTAGASTLLGGIALLALLAVPAFACTATARLEVVGQPSPVVATAGSQIDVRVANTQTGGTLVKIVWVDAASVKTPAGALPGGGGTLSVTVPSTPGIYTLTGSQSNATASSGNSTVTLTPVPVEVKAAQATSPVGSTTPVPAEAPAAPAVATEATPTAAPAPAAASTPATPARTAAPVTATQPRQAAAPAPVAVATDETPAPQPAAVEATPASPRTVSNDLWSGLTGRTDAQPSLVAPADAGSSVPAAGVALLALGTLTLLAGLGLATLRRTRSRATA